MQYALFRYCAITIQNEAWNANNIIMAAYHCCVPLCTNDSRYDAAKTLTFHRIPKHEVVRKTWIARIRRDVGPHFKVSD